MLVPFGSSVLLLPSLAAWDSKKQKNHKKHHQVNSRKNL
jgi:hypothetical protein